MKEKSFKDFEKAIYTNKKEELVKYYQNKGLTIIGLNDSRLVNTTILFKKGLLKYLADSLRNDKIDPMVINAFSVMFNKTEHINYLLESNLSLDEIKDLQVYSIVSTLEKTMQDFHMPKFIGQVGHISRALYMPKKGDKKIFLTDTLKDAKEPIVIYSCGANDLIREAGNNPFDIDKEYKNRDKNLNYGYAVYKLQDKSTTKKIIGRIEENINNILTLNSNADIFALNLYVSRSMQCDGMKIFNDAIQKYNEYLQELCIKYGVTYIETEKNGDKYGNSNINFHISAVENKDLGREIVEALYNKKFWETEQVNINSEHKFTVQNHKIMDLYVNLKHDLEKIISESQGSFGKQKEIYDEMQKELQRQIGVVEKVAMKKI